MRSPIGYDKPYAATLYNWDKYLISALAKVFALYLFDARQVGHSHSQNEETIDGYIEDIHQAIIQLGIRQPIIAGWSFGGVVARRLYQVYPDDIFGLIMLSSFSSPNMAFSQFINSSSW